MLEELKKRPKAHNSDGNGASSTGSKVRTFAAAEPSNKDSLASNPQKVTPRRRLWFILIAGMIPFVALCILEVGLRLGGYRYESGFFISYQDGPIRTLVENHKFGWRFFPRKIARSPLPIKISAQKARGTIRIFLFGESAAMGDPEPSYGVGRQLERIMQKWHPTNRIEVVNVAMTAINSHVIREIAGDCASLEGDVWVIYAGNNEVVGPFGAGTVFGPAAPEVGVVRTLLGLKKLRIWQLLTGFKEDSGAPREWEGMEFFLNNQVAVTDPRLSRVYENFERNLSAIVQAGQRSGAKVILSTMAVNLRDCPPFSSMHRAGLTGAEEKKWGELLAKGKIEESSGAYSNALRFYAEAAQLDGDYAELSYRQGTCELRQGQKRQARSDFLHARDLDSLRFRADTKMNAIVTRITAERGASLVDAEAVLETNSPMGVSGKEFFYDHVHLNFTGNHQLAAVLAEEVEHQLSGAKRSTAAMPEERAVASELAFTGFDAHRVGEEMRMRLQQPPFSTQSNFKERDDYWKEWLNAQAPGSNEFEVEYRAALKLFPEDWVLHANFGRLLESTGDRAGATEQWERVAETMGHEPDAFFHLGNLAYERGAYGEAAQQFRQSLARRAWSSEAHNGLGLALTAQGQTGSAKKEYQQALKENPRFSAARVNLASLLAQEGKVKEAKQEYETVLKAETNNAAAAINLAKMYFGEGKTNEAIGLYARALQARPNNAIGHFDLGNALNSQGRHAEALQEYQAAVRYQPELVDAQYNLGLELARAGRVADSITHLEIVARLNPKFGAGHFNYGVALAKLQRYPEAAREFRAALKLEPDNAPARALLNKALERSSQPPGSP